MNQWMPSHIVRPLLIYIHGFISSPKSEKARQLQRFVVNKKLAIDLAVPQLSDRPEQAFQQLVRRVEKEVEEGRGQIALIGSSLGGFWATVLAERFGLRAVLINPAVRPAVHAQKLIGEHCNIYTGKQFDITLDDCKALRELEPDELNRRRNFWLLVQTADETLDYREALLYYRGARQTVEQGGSHSFDGFVRHLPQILEFLQIPMLAGKEI